MKKLLPAAYFWLLGETVLRPPMLYYALNAHGVEEGEGAVNNETILGWAREAADAGAGEWLAEFYKEDSIPWCGLFMAMCAARSAYPVQADCLSARGWLDWGREAKTPGLGDVLVFWRGKPDGKSGHVGLYVGEDDLAFHVLGGNQGDQVSITRIRKTRLLGVRRYPSAVVGDPVKLKPAGKLSENEA